MGNLELTSKTSKKAKKKIKNKIKIPLGKLTKFQLKLIHKAVLRKINLGITLKTLQ